MKIKVALLSLGLASTGFALDEYMPIDAGTLEIDAGVSHVAPDEGDAFQDIPLAVKYGIMPGLTVELASTYSLEEDRSGLTQPELALKYQVPDTDFGAFVNVVLPFATGDRDVDGLNLGIAPGVLMDMDINEQINLIAMAYYQINLEADDVKDGNVLSVLLKPAYRVNNELAAYVSAIYHMHAENELSGTGLGNDGYDLVLAPGATYTLSDALSFEANVPFTIAEDNEEKYWGINALVYYTLGF